MVRTMRTGAPAGSAPNDFDRALTMLCVPYPVHSRVSSAHA